MYCTILYHVILYCIVLYLVYHIILYYVVLCHIISYCIVLYNVYCIVSYPIVSCHFNKLQEYCKVMCCTHDLLLMSKCVLVQMDDFSCLNFEMVKKKSPWSWLCTKTTYAHLDAQPYTPAIRILQAGSGRFLHLKTAGCHLSHHSPPPPPALIHTQTHTHAHTGRWSRRAVSRLHISRKAQVHALPLPLANYHLQTPCIVSPLPVSDL